MCGRYFDPIVLTELLSLFSLWLGFQRLGCPSMSQLISGCAASVGQHQIMPGFMVLVPVQGPGGFRICCVWLGPWEKNQFCPGLSKWASEYSQLVPGKLPLGN